MAAPTDPTPVIAETGHIYVADPGASLAATDLATYTFNAAKPDHLKGWTWLGDTSSENLPEFESDGGDQNAVHTWDRKSLRVTTEAKTHTVKFSAVTTTDAAMSTAFPGSTWNVQDKAWDVNLDGTVDKAVLMVVEDGEMVCAHLFSKVTLSGSLPSLDAENFSEIEISGTILDMPGKPKYRFYTPRKPTPAV